MKTYSLLIVCAVLLALIAVPTGAIHAKHDAAPLPFVLKTIPVGEQPKGVTVNADTNEVYVALLGENRIARVHPLNDYWVDYGYTGDSPNQIAVNHNNQRVYVTNRDADNVSVLDENLLTPIKTIDVGDRPWGIAVNPDTAEVLVANYGSSSLTYINDNVGTTGTILLPPNDELHDEAPALVAFGRSLGRFYITGWHSGTLYVIDQQGRIFKPMNIVMGALGLAVAPGEQVYVANRLNDFVYYADAYVPFPESLNPQWSAQLDGANALAVNSFTNHMFVVDAKHDSVDVLDRMTGQLLTTLPVGRQNEDEGGQGIAVMVDQLHPENNLVFVSNYEDGTLTVIQDGQPVQSVLWLRGHVYDALVGKSQGIYNASVLVHIACAAHYTVSGTDISGYYSMTLPNDLLDQCGSINVVVFQEGYQTIEARIRTPELRAQPKRNWGMQPACSVKPNKPVPVSPANGATVTVRQVPLNWKPTPCAETYRVVVRADTKKGPIVDHYIHLAGSNYTTNPLDPGKTYYWRAKACNALGCRKSAAWAFTITADAR